MALQFNVKMDLTLAGSSFTDETHDSVGASAFNLNHLWFINDTTSGDVLVIRDAAAGGGNLLIENTDYTISNQDNFLSGEDQVDKAVYSDITITNAAYQGVVLYISGKYVGDSVKASHIGQVTYQYEAKTATETLAPTGYMTYGCAAGSNGIKLTLPAVSTDLKGLRLEFIKTDSTNTAVMIDGSGAETINGLTHILLIEQYQKATIMCTGSAWIMLPGSILLADTGWVNTNDETNRHFGTVDVDYDGLVGAFQIGEKVTESGGETGIILKDTGTTLTLWRVADSGVFTNNNTLLGAISGATADVDEPGTGSTKNLDSNFYHGFGKNIYTLDKKIFISTDKTEANTQEMFPSDDVTAGNTGFWFFGIDTNNIQLQTGSSGVLFGDVAGNASVLSASNYYYRIIIKLVI